MCMGNPLWPSASLAGKQSLSFSLFSSRLWFNSRQNSHPGKPWLQSLRRSALSPACQLHSVSCRCPETVCLCNVPARSERDTLPRVVSREPEHSIAAYLLFRWRCELPPGKATTAHESILAPQDQSSFGM